MGESDSVQLSFNTDSSEGPAPDPLWLAAVEQVRKAAAAADEALDRHKASAAAWKKLRDAFAKDQADAVARILEDPRQRQSLEQIQALKPTLDRLRLASTARVQSRTTKLAEAAAAFAEQQRWPASKTTGGVRVGHFIRIVPDPRGSTKVGSQRVRSLDWESVKPVLESEYARLWQKSDEEVDAFASEVSELLSGLKAELGEGDYVRLKSVYNGIIARRPKKHGAIPSYFRDEFSADLSLLLKRQQRATRGERFELAAIRNPELAFEVVQPDGNLAQYGFIRQRRP